jgi:circadian clock protein KaiB
MMSSKSKAEDQLVLTLFVSGASPNSVRAINNLQRILEDHAKGNYELSVIDVHQDKTTAEREQIIALPLLIKRSPQPERRLVGDMSDMAKVLKGLGIVTD